MRLDADARDGIEVHGAARGVQYARGLAPGGVRRPALGTRGGLQLGGRECGEWGDLSGSAAISDYAGGSVDINGSRNGRSPGAGLALGDGAIVCHLPPQKTGITLPNPGIQNRKKRF